LAYDHTLFSEFLNAITQALGFPVLLMPDLEYFYLHVSRQRIHVKALILHSDIFEAALFGASGLFHRLPKPLLMAPQ
jgi:hypothetical protein